MHKIVYSNLTDEQICNQEMIVDIIHEVQSGKMDIHFRFKDEAYHISVYNLRLLYEWVRDNTELLVNLQQTLFKEQIALKQKELADLQKFIDNLNSKLLHSVDDLD